jgi:hypothetical protein
MPNITNTLIANITATEDSTQNVIVNRSNGSPSFDSTTALSMEYFVLGAGANGIPLPVSPCTQVYIKNIDVAKSFSVNWTPNGGGAAVIIELNPSDSIMLWAKPGGSVTPGITGLTITPSAAGCLVEYFLGG